MTATYKPKSILITGAAGFIASHVANRLVCNYPQTHVDNSFDDSFEFTKNNIYGTQVLLEACKVTGALLAHPRMLMMPDIEMHIDGSEETKSMASQSMTSNSQNGMVLPAPKSSVMPPKKPYLKFLIYGKTGWIGCLLGKICEKQGIPYEYGRGSLEEYSHIILDIQNMKPTHVFNAAGMAGRPNIDWCESRKQETIRTDVVGTLTLADVCREHDLLLLN
ncbi:hypothetical protein BHM03_00002143 [Ensete ventricosum]|uniref:NAD-dependent epimerase/dehydratase domain-containing protein n=1 Tax=Ensete ventricosum TaxID=4639 RepID=A0A445M9I0_ENSVE|nr:hypothetical protein BHM03_00002143 [Ensete ventricosum]